MNYAIFNRPIVTVYDTPNSVRQSPIGQTSTIGDEALYGGTCKILAGPGGVDTNGALLGEDMVELLTAYGYHGYAHAGELSFASERKLRSWLHGNYSLVSRVADVMNVPDVQGLCYMTLQRGCTIETLPERAEDAPDNGLPVKADGWQRVRMIDGRVGYIRTTSLKKKIFSRSAVFYLEETRKFTAAAAMARGIAEEHIIAHTVDSQFDGNEELFRESVIDTALQYLGTQYRWGGKTTSGIDCSGLASMAYMQNGVLIYRDAKIVDGWPVKEIDRAQMKPADLIFFPGHVAIYLGQGRYVHSTGAGQSGGVVVNSFVPSDPLYRKEMLEKITAVGSVFGH